MELNEAVLRDKLRNLNVSSTSIEGTSAWVCYHRAHANRIAAIWEDVFSRADDGKRLALLYLTNDIVQNSRRKGPEFAAEFFRVLPRALKHFLARCDESTRKSALRVVRIWDERRVFGFGGRRVLQELLDGVPGAAAQPASSPGAVVQGPRHPGPDGPAAAPSVDDLYALVAAAEAARQGAAAAAERLAALPVREIMGTLDAVGVGQVQAGLAAALEGAEAEAGSTAAAAKAAASIARALAQREEAARTAARQFQDRALQLDRALAGPRSPDLGSAVPKVPAAGVTAGALNGSGTHPVAVLGQSAVPPAMPPAAPGEEYDPDDPF